MTKGEGCGGWSRCGRSRTGSRRLRAVAKHVLWQGLYISRALRMVDAPTRATGSGSGVPSSPRSTYSAKCPTGPRPPSTSLLSTLLQFPLAPFLGKSSPLSVVHVARQAPTTVMAAKGFNEQILVDESKNSERKRKAREANRRNRPRVDCCNNSSLEHCTSTACGGEPRR